MWNWVKKLGSALKSRAGVGQPGLTDDHQRRSTKLRQIRYLVPAPPAQHHLRTMGLPWKGQEPLQNLLSAFHARGVDQLPELRIVLQGRILSQR